MRKLLFSFLFLISCSVFSNDLETLTEAFLQKHVSNGSVDYQAIAKDDTELKQLIQVYGVQSLANYSPAEVKAFYINAYNVAVIDQIVSNYPVASPQQLAGFFDSKKFSIAGEQLTLNQIEKQKLNPKEDPRLHFVLVCAAKSCPVIEPFAYHAAKLDEQLDQQTRKALNDPAFIRVDEAGSKVELSKIFSWYKADFKEKALDVLIYINGFRNKPISSKAQISYYEYDWNLNGLQSLDGSVESSAKSNLQLFTPSALFEWGQYEINVFNSIYIQDRVRDSKGKIIDIGRSESFFNSMIQYTSGIPGTNRINVGVEANVTTARYGASDESVNHFFNSETTTYRKTVLSSIGPRVKVVPFTKIPRLSVQSTFLFPIADMLEAPRFIAHDRFTWFTQLFFDQSIGESFQIFLEADVLHRINRHSAAKGNFTRTPLSAFFSYFPSSKFTVYVFSQYSPRFESIQNSMDLEEEYGLSQWFTQAGLGLKYQATSKLGLEASYSNFVDSRSDGAGYTLNFGLRYIYR